MTTSYFRWRPSLRFFSHGAKAALLRHHLEMEPALRRLLAPDAVVLDAGAHGGQFTKLFARLAPSGLVVAVEPGTYARAVLRVALWLNRVRNVVVVPAALGATCGAAILRVPVKRKGSYGFGLAHLAGTAPGVEARFDVVEDIVPVLTIDELAARLKLTRLDFIKADIEGFELRMIEGGVATLKALRPVLYLELIDSHLRRAGDSLAAAWTRLRGLGYAPYRLAPEGSVPEGSIGVDFEAAPEMRDGDLWWFPDRGT